MSPENSINLTSCIVTHIKTRDLDYIETESLLATTERWAKKYEAQSLTSSQRLASALFTSFTCCPLHSFKRPQPSMTLTITNYGTEQECIIPFFAWSIQSTMNNTKDCALRSNDKQENTHASNSIQNGVHDDSEINFNVTDLKNILANSSKYINYDAIFDLITKHQSLVKKLLSPVSAHISSSSFSHHVPFKSLLRANEDDTSDDEDDNIKVTSTSSITSGFCSQTPNLAYLHLRTFDLLSTLYLILFLQDIIATLKQDTELNAIRFSLDLHSYSCVNIALIQFIFKFFIPHIHPSYIPYEAPYNSLIAECYSSLVAADATQRADATTYTALESYKDLTSFTRSYTLNNVGNTNSTRTTNVRTAFLEAFDGDIIPLLSFAKEYHSNERIFQQDSLVILTCSLCDSIIASFIDCASEQHLRIFISIGGSVLLESEPDTPENNFYYQYLSHASYKHNSPCNPNDYFVIPSKVRGSSLSHKLITVPRGRLFDSLFIEHFHYRPQSTPQYATGKAVLE